MQFKTIVNIQREVMTDFDILLLGIILIFPVVDLINEKKYKSENKKIEYLKITLFLWVPALILVYSYALDELSIADLGVGFEASWRNISVVSLLCLAIIYLFVLIRSIQANDELRAEIARKFERYKDILPVTRNEMLIFTLILSVSAGICEELIFRAYLYPFLDGHMGMVVAIILSSAVFGLWHLYLGWQEVIKTSVMGALFCGIYIFTGNIILPILVHIFIDVYSGLMAYFAMRKPLHTATS